MQTQSEKKSILDIDDLRRLIFLDNGYFTEARHLLHFTMRVDADGGPLSILKDQFPTPTPTPHPRQPRGVSLVGSRSANPVKPTIRHLAELFP